MSALFSRLECRQIMHDAEYQVRRAQAESLHPHKLAATLAKVERAYLDSPEPRICQRLHVAMDLLGDLA